MSINLFAIYVLFTEEAQSSWPWFHNSTIVYLFGIILTISKQFITQIQTSYYATYIIILDLKNISGFYNSIPIISYF